MKAIDADYTEQFLLPRSLEDWVGADHPARFIREMVASADLKKLGFRVETATEGRPPFSDALLLRVWLYGYMEKIRSARALEKACRNQMGFVWLCGNQAPDHNTLWRFFARNKKALAGVFKLTVRTAIKLDLVGMVLEAVDGTKIQSACSGRGVFNEASLQDLEQKLDQQIGELEGAIEQDHEQDPEGTGLPGKLQNTRDLRAKVREALALVQNGETRHCQPHEPEARRMECDGRNRFGYNAQAVVDAKAQVMVAAEVVNLATDETMLVPMARAANEMTGSNAVTLADGGYGSSAGFAQAEREGLNVLGKLPSGSRNDDLDPYHASRFGYDAGCDEVVCPQGQRIPFARLRNRDGVDVRVYRSAAICKHCPARSLCTKDRHGRTIERHPDHEARERMRERLEREKGLIRQRAKIVEPVFAQIKANQGFRRWTFRGLPNVRAQWNLIASAWNLRKIYSIWRQMPDGFPAAG